MAPETRPSRLSEARSLKTQDSKGGSFKPPLGQCGRRAHDLEFEFEFKVEFKSGIWAAPKKPHPFSLGSSASLSPSPNRLNASTVRNIAKLGKIATCGAITISARASLSIAPHSGVGGCAPMPRNERLAAVMIDVPMRMVK